MRKLLTLVCAMLASFSLWAVDPTYQSSEWATQADAEAALGAHNHVTLAQFGLGYGNLGSNGSFYFIINNQTLKYSDDPQKYLSVVADENYLIDSVSIWYCENGGNETNIAWVAWGEGVTPAQKTLLHGETAGTTGAKKLDNAKWVTIDVHSQDVQTLYLARKVSGFQDAEGSKINDFGKSQTFNILGFKVWIHKTCTDPEFTVSPTEGTGFVDDAINIAVTSKNQSKPINPTVTVDGVEGVYGTDYTFSASTGLVQATPLKAGTFVVTFSQASDGTYCDAEESATFVISEKAAVTSFEVEGPTSARVGDEITLTAKNFDAAATSIWWTDKYGQTLVSTAEYTFTPEAEGTIELTAWAENEFNTNPVTVPHNVTVTIGHNALLSDLKVNGATIEGFDDEVFEYNLGEIGVYEPVKVEATPADAPYATATVNPGNNNVLITVFAQDQTTYKSYTIKYTRKAATELASISGDATWDFTKTGASTIQLSNETLPTKTEEFVYADLLTNPDASFNAAALAGIQEYVVRDGKYAQGSQLKFNTTVSGTLEVIYCNTGNRSDEGDRRFLVVNGEKIGEGSMVSSKNDTISNISVAAGEVVLTGLLKKDESAQYLRFHKVTFTKSETTALDNTADEPKATKRIENGQLIIEKNGETFNVLGTRVR